MSVIYRLNPFSARLNYSDLQPSELREFYQHFINSLAERTSILADAVRRDDAFGSWVADLTPESLRVLDTWFASNVQTRHKTEIEIFADKSKSRFDMPVPSVTLTDETFSLAADVGMYFARVIMRLYPHLRWKLPLAPRTYIDYGQPVIEGFRGNVCLNPVRIATNVAWSTSRGQSGALELWRVFNVWRREVAVPSNKAIESE